MDLPGLVPDVGASWLPLLLALHPDSLGMDPSNALTSGESGLYHLFHSAFQEEGMTSAKMLRPKRR